ncbi:MAG TPA: NADH-quinone oxidoreductase subunit H [Dehalococcoidales bacterium]|nr:NADH-quinone oxidoreductase subunit H [Dehalococcoidales bacterium]
MSIFIYAIVNVAFVVLISPLFMSLIKKVKAYIQGRKGPPLFQTYYMLLKLMKKERVYSENASLIMRITPYVNIVCVIVAALFVPLIYVPQPFGGIGNIILFLYLLVCAKFFMALAGLDAGSTFGGMGSSREMTFSAIIEPVIITIFAALSMLMKATNLFNIFSLSIQSSLFMNPEILLVSISLFIILIVETSRIPVDNPETHLELTMIHEAMTLEFSGSDLALMETSHAIKQTLLMAVLVNILFPFGLTANPGIATIAVSIVMFVAKTAVLSIIVGIFESMFAKSRLFRLPNLFMIAFFFSFSTILFELLK